MSRGNKGKKRSNSFTGGERFNKAAKEEGYRARSVYKLTEIQKRLRPLSPGHRVLDLGCAPGSWARYAQQIVGRRGQVVGVDLKPVPSLAGVHLIQGDVFEIEHDVLREALGGAPDVVMSDMAPNTTGDRFGDHVRQVEVARRALQIALALLEPGGHFICKVFEGEDAQGFVADVRAGFAKTKRMKPEAVRPGSVEFFVVGLGRE